MRLQTSKNYYRYRPKYFYKIEEETACEIAKACESRKINKQGNAERILSPDRGGSTLGQGARASPDSVVATRFKS